jgi:hypothetical protein
LLFGLGSTGAPGCCVAVLSIAPFCVTVAVMVRIAVAVCANGPALQIPVVLS